MTSPEEKPILVLTGRPTWFRGYFLAIFILSLLLPFGSSYDNLAELVTFWIMDGFIFFVAYLLANFAYNARRIELYEHKFRAFNLLEVKEADYSDIRIGERHYWFIKSPGLFRGTDEILAVLPAWNLKRKRDELGGRTVLDWLSERLAPPK